MQVVVKHASCGSEHNLYIRGNFIICLFTTLLVGPFVVPFLLE